MTPTHQDWVGHHQGSHPGPASNSPEQGDGNWASLGCSRTHGVGTPSLAPLGPTLLRRCIQSQWEAVECGAFLKYEQTDLLKAYIRRPPLHIQRESHTMKKRKKGYTFVQLLARLEQEVREERVRGIAEQWYLLPLVLSELCTSGGWSARLVEPFYTCTSTTILLIGVRSSCFFFWFDSLSKVIIVTTYLWVYHLSS